jgi:hypothetical protein
MGFTPKEIADLQAMGFTPAQVQAAENRKAREEQQKKDVAALQAAGVTEATVATLIEEHGVALSESHEKDSDGNPLLYPDGSIVYNSDWVGTVIGGLPFDDLGVSVKVTITVTAPDAFPELRDAIVARKAAVKALKGRRKNASKLASAPRLSA